MTHYYLKGGNPTAIITRKNDELRVYENNAVYLNDKDNFEIRLFNPLQSKVGVEIRINGKATSNALLVLNPGQDVILDRHIDEKRKFLYETYVVDKNNPQVQQAIANNGLIEILFYNEKVHVSYDWSTTYYNYPCTFTGGPVYGNGSTTTSSSSSVVGSSSTNLGPTKKRFKTSYKSPGIPLQEKEESRSINFCQNLEETGVVGKGDYSNQNFQNVNVEFESYYFHKIEYKLMPVSSYRREEPRETYDVTNVRNYCPHCKLRIRKQSWIFCPKCGEKL